MAVKILLKRGTKAQLDAGGVNVLQDGELGFCTDTKEVFIGNTSGTGPTLVGRALSGTLASRPNAGVQGRLYFVTTGEQAQAMFYDTGTMWIKLNPQNLDEISDGSTYGKVRNTELNGGKVKQISDGTNTVTAAVAKTHIDDATKHRVINDSAITSTNLWSAAKINTEIANAIRGHEWQASVLSMDVYSPPASPKTGDRYLIPWEMVSGTWAGKEQQIAEWDGAGWLYFQPEVGWTVYVDNRNKNIVWNGTGWVASGEANQTIVAGNGLTGGGFSDEITLNVGAGNGITVSADAVAVKPANGITVSSSGVGVKAGTGINVDSSGVGVKLGKGLEIDTSGNVGVRGSSSVSVANGEVMVIANRGLAYGPLGLDVDLDNETIKFGAGNKLYVDKVDGGTF